MVQSMLESLERYFVQVDRPITLPGEQPISAKTGTERVQNDRNFVQPCTAHGVESCILVMPDTQGPRLVKTLCLEDEEDRKGGC